MRLVKKMRRIGNVYDRNGNIVSTIVLDELEFGEHRRRMEENEEPTVTGAGA